MRRAKCSGFSSNPKSNGEGPETGREASDLSRENIALHPRRRRAIPAPSALAPHCGGSERAPRVCRRSIVVSPVARRWPRLRRAGGNTACAGARAPMRVSSNFKRSQRVAVALGLTRRIIDRTTIMQLKRAGTLPSQKGPAEYFTGVVRIDPLNAPPLPSRVACAAVTFEPGARTAWHTHPLGQTLIVTAGCGGRSARARRLSKSALATWSGSCLATSTGTEPPQPRL